MRRIFVISFLLALGLFAVPSVKAVDHAEALAPVLDEQTFLIGRLDLSKIKLDKLIETMQEGLEQQAEMLEGGNLPNEMQQSMAMMPMLIGMFAQQIEENILDPLVKKGGVTDIYMIANLSHVLDPESEESLSMLEGGFSAAIIVPWTGKTEPQQKAIRNTFTDSGMFPIRFVRYGFFFAIPGDESNIDEIGKTVKKVFGKIEPQKRSEVSEAFEALKDCDLQLILMQPKGYENLSYEQIIRKSVEEAKDAVELQMDTKLTGSDDTAMKLVEEQLSLGIRWTAIGLNLEKLFIDWVIQSNGPGEAKKTSDAAKKLIDIYAAQVVAELEGVKKDDLKSLLEDFLPKETKNEQLSIRYDSEFYDGIKEKRDNLQKALKAAMEKKMKGQF